MYESGSLASYGIEVCGYWTQECSLKKEAVEIVLASVLLQVEHPPYSGMRIWPSMPGN